MERCNLCGEYTNLPNYCIRHYRPEFRKKLKEETTSYCPNCSIFQDKLHRRNMQIKELKKKTENVIEKLNETRDVVYEIDIKDIEIEKIQHLKEIFNR